MCRTRWLCKDDDTAGVSISPNSLSIREGRRKNYTIKLDSEPTSDVTVTVDLPANADFTVNPGTITFTPQSWGPKYVYVESNDDDDAADEPPTVITHTVVSSDTKYSGFAAGSVSVSIKDDDDPVVTVNFEHSTYSVAESDDASTTSEKENEVTVTVTLDAEPERTVDITLIPTNQGASNSDYSLSATSLTFGSHGDLQELHLHGCRGHRGRRRRERGAQLRAPARRGVAGTWSLRPPSPSPTTTCRPWR